MLRILWYIVVCIDSVCFSCCFFFFKQKTAYEMRISDWSSDVCSSDLQYVDSHGQSAVGFAFCRLLGFELAPRLKAVARQKLAFPQAGMRTRLSNLLPILSSPIDWDEIEQQYDEMVKYAAAMQSRTADPEAILLR